MNNRIQKTLDERKIGDTKVELLTFPIGQLFEEKEKINRKILNVIYILCMKERPIPRIPFKDLQKCTDKIVLLFSDEVAEWALDINEKKIEIKRVAQTRFYKEYKKKNYNSFVKWRPDFDIPIKNGFPSNVWMVIILPSLQFLIKSAMAIRFPSITVSLTLSS